MGYWTSHFQSSEEKEVGAISESNIVPFVDDFLEDAKLNNGWWINRSTIRRGWKVLISATSGKTEL